MRNHNQKSQDMAKSVLPSTRRKGARDDRVLIHKRERARVRAAAGKIRNRADHDDRDDADLYFRDKGAIRDMVSDRRSADKIAPLERWASRRVVMDPALRDQDWAGRMAVLRRAFPDNTIGRHALSHIEYAVGTPPHDQFRYFARIGRGVDDRADGINAAVATILSAGAHGELNRRLKREVPTTFIRLVRTPRGKIVEAKDRPLRLLLGQHDAAAFAADAIDGLEEAVVIDFAAELSGPRGYRT